LKEASEILARRDPWHRTILIALVALHAVLAGVAAARLSSTWDEGVIVYAGLRQLETGAIELDRRQPFLSKIFAASFLRLIDRKSVV
jgi:hypothetical protein